MKPILSIIIPCYNQEKYLDETLQSVINQDLQNWECIIVNDGSTDKSEDIAKRWIEKDSRFKYYSKANSGVSDTRNYGIARANAQFILPLDSDDLISKTYTTEAIEVFNNQPDTKVVYSNLTLFGTENKQIVLNTYQYEKMLVENQIFCPAIFRKSDFLKTNGYNTNMVSGLEDWDFWLSFLSKNDKVVKLDGFHLFYRKLSHSRSTEIDKQKNEMLILQIFKNHLDLYLQYFNPIRNKIEADYYKQECNNIKDSTSYKIGNIITLPFRLIGRFLGKKS